MISQQELHPGPNQIVATLAVIPSLPVHYQSPDRVVLTQKFVEGMTRYAELWDGNVVAVMHPSSEPQTGNLDDAVFEVASLPFEITAASFPGEQLYAALDTADVVMLGGDHRLTDLVRWCRSRNKKTVFVTEYSFRTRIQIINAEYHNPFIRLRKYVWEWRQEQRNRLAVTAADATQCNGLPTYDAYRKSNTNTLLFLDSRIDADMLASREDVARRHSHMAQGNKVRLAFSGRLSAMKGADHLIEVAHHLNELGVAFTLNIFGDGPLRGQMEQQTQRYGLNEIVRFNGVVDFSSELLPCIRNETDLFVCCHRQGDPSCTYLETFACGVPVIGYANEALSGLVRNRPVGWTTPLNQPARLARRIVELLARPQRLTDAGYTALEFARRHTFAIEFGARVDQARRLLA